MHSRTFAQILSRLARPGLIALALLGTARAGEGCLYQPMSGACFLHDSGMEYIPSRLLGVEDVAISADRGEERREGPSWTCSDPSLDCALQAERFERREALLVNWGRVRTSLQSMRTWANHALADGSLRAIQQWNASLSSLGDTAVRWVGNEQTDRADCPWDRTAYEKNVSVDTPPSLEPRPAYASGNIFVFYLSASIENSADPKVGKTEGELDASPETETPTRNAAWLERTAFARDYCIFAPYPLVDDRLTSVDSFPGSQDPIAASPTSDSTQNHAAQIREQSGMRLKRSVSLALAKGLAWLGKRMVESSAQLENSVRIASDTDTSLSLEVK